MISLQRVTKSYGEKAIVEDLSLHLPRGTRLGVVGPNGAGKTTLFGMISGEIEPDSGRIESSSGHRLAYLRQVLQGSLVSRDLLGHVESGRPDLEAIHREMEALSGGLNGGDANAMGRLGELEAAYEAGGGYRLRHRAQATLCGLGFAMDQMHEPLVKFSGGWQMRAELARVLVSEPDTLMLDEPTNYLDVPAVEWLRRFLEEFDGTLILISHDRYMLNTLTDETLELALGKGTRYTGNYNAYVKASQSRREQVEAAAARQEREIAKTKEFIDRFRAQATKAAQVQSRIKQLEKIEQISVGKVIRSSMRLKLREPVRSGEEVIRLDGAGLTYDGNRWIFRNVDLAIQRGDRVALVGPNGAGKSTLLRVLAGELTLKEGKRYLGHHVTPGYQSQEFSHLLDSTATVWETVRQVSARPTDQEVRGILGAMGFPGDDVDKKVAVLSGGETIRLLFARVLSDPPNFLVLDEPTTHLDIPSREKLQQALADFTGTICVVSHDIEFLRGVATQVIALGTGDVVVYPGGYDYYCSKIAENGGNGAEKKPEPAAEAKVDRRADAERRQEKNREIRKTERDLEAAEKKVAELEAKQSELAAQFADASANADFAALGLQMKAVQSELSETVSRWERLAGRLEWLRTNG